MSKPIECLDCEYDDWGYTSLGHSLYQAECNECGFVENIVKEKCYTLRGSHRSTRRRNRYSGERYIYGPLR